jgi:hypothetical protein
MLINTLQHAEKSHKNPEAESTVPDSSQFVNYSAVSAKEVVCCSEPELAVTMTVVRVE